MVHLWSPPDPLGRWSGYRRLVLQNQKLSVGSSSFHPVSGIHYVHHEDALIISLFDGSFHVVHNISHEPSWSPQLNASFTSESLSQVSRSVFIRAERRAMGNADMNRISGMVSYDGSATVIWLHEYNNLVCFMTDALTFSLKGMVAPTTLVISMTLRVEICSLRRKCGTSPVIVWFCRSSQRS